MYVNTCLVHEHIQNFTNSDFKNTIPELTREKLLHVGACPGDYGKMR